jgi:transposase-like protein
MTDLTDALYHDENVARTHFERIRWPDGPTCPHCGVVNEATLVQGKSHRPGMYQCNACKEPFTVTVGTVMESSHIPLCKWALAFHLYAASKKGFSAHQLHRMLGITYKSAWFMAHRIREAMKDSDPTPIGGEGKSIEVDETYIGKKPDVFENGKGWRKPKRGGADMHRVVTLVERGGRARSIKVDNMFTSGKVYELLAKNADLRSALNTDELPAYKEVGKEFAEHGRVHHRKKEYVRGDVHTNTVEGFFSIFKRGMRGVYQHCGDRHLARYLAEFDFRYSNRIALEIDDVMRTEMLIRAAEGKRLTYQQSSRARTA